ncbi:MAG TPA: hypothetical protein VED45_11390 [Steroidobacteraceae bacterium]|nr:hypothetical protein [Steroidobacteraceae bacterium]
MRGPIALTGVAAALLLGACDVQVRDATPAQYVANHDLGMYEVAAIVRRDALVTPGSVFLFAMGGGQRIALNPSADGSEWHGLYSVRCRSSFPLQFQAQWKQLFDLKQKLVPAQPREVRLIEPPLAREARFDTSGPAPKGGWQGGVQYRFVTVPSVRITSAHIEPASGAPADIAAAQGIAVLTALPLVAGCAEPVEVHLASSASRARGVLVIDTDHPTAAHWRTQVEFSPQ